MNDKDKQEIVSITRQFGDWCSPNKTLDLIDLVEKVGEGAVILEIGVFKGQSLFSMAHAVKKLGYEEVLLFGIDPYKNEACTEGCNDDLNNQWWQSIDMNAIKLGVYGVIAQQQLPVMILEMKSEDAYNSPFASAYEYNIIHIDGNHSEEKSIQDVELWTKRLKQGGYLVMDDVNWPHTQKALELINREFTLLIEGRPDHGSHYNIYQKN
jgi:predicted O-methyltransferase YrrM